MNEPRTHDEGREELLVDRLEQLHRIGLALSAEKDVDALLDTILGHARELTGADAGTVYVREPDSDALRFAVLHNDTLQLRQGGGSGEAVGLAPIRLYRPDGTPDLTTVAGRVAHTGEPVRLADAYREVERDLDATGTFGFDARSGYVSRSFLAVPMKDHEGNVLGVLQLINARGADGQPEPFSTDAERVVGSLASQAAVALDNRFEARAARQLAGRLKMLTDVGVALSAERDIGVLLEGILLSAKELSGADGGTLYLLSPDGSSLHFAILRNDSLGIALGGTTGREVEFEPLPLYGADGSPNHAMVAAHVALTGEVVHVPDAYTAEGFDFSGTRAFDEQTGYRSRSFLTVPLKDHEDELLGVLQLINALDPVTGEAAPFTASSRDLVASLASQAAVALTNRKLIEDLKRLFDAFIRSLATAIDKKSPYTGGHCQRVPVLTLMLADAAAAEGEGPLASFTMTPDQRYELQVAAWLHDCGKVATPEHVVDKSTKLETIYDRIETVRLRYALLERDAEIDWLRGQLAARGMADAREAAAADPGMAATRARLAEEMAFLARCNVGGEAMRDDDVARVEAIARTPLRGPHGEGALLDEDEVENLTVRRGTLTAAERQIINDHVVVSIEMLEQLPYPKKLRNVPEFAGGHHEKMDGTGYPRGLKGEDMSLQARMMAIADIFEALTAHDRPYRRPNRLSEALRVLGFMRLDGHVDPDLFDLFVRRGVWLEYARRHLSPEQIDEVDLAAIPGFRPLPKGEEPAAAPLAGQRVQEAE
jgi:HD-GYP domain-containing protein (c-di-GMP phosphodiesterase class II)